jgi:DNA polymerase-3 subunit delta
LDDVVAVVADASALALDGVIDAAFAGRTADTEAQFSKAVAAGTSAGTILSWAVRYVTQLHKARLALDAGEDTFAAMRSFIPPIHFRREAMVKAALNSWTAPRLERAMELLAERRAAGPSKKKASARKAPAKKSAAKKAGAKKASKKAPDAMTRSVKKAGTRKKAPAKKQG